MTNLKITRVRGDVGAKQNQRATMRTLGLRKIGQSTVREDSEQLRGYLRAVAHLVKVEEAN
ncbi:50S ribosomal protein L30 [Boudabousia liubingyangii]|uniref:Large ribosomal subunit protein uL30 n=2 Tax=Boudabousia liubingyangii TaxID=1921764 RepID=A0A1Q5PQH8_9ACTO|nr:50S ribosomal protein L30 [Boudabousia liubingyangii]OKL48236.1 50S ribosomal protein L30 [Boudabousia liubingyangii]OKL49729.1 50S ribosomal protein L30 [Boudabousia liubingyangii]